MDKRLEEEELQVTDWDTNRLATIEPRGINLVDGFMMNTKNFEKLNEEVISR